MFRSVTLVVVSFIVACLVDEAVALNTTTTTTTTTSAVPNQTSTTTTTTPVTPPVHTTPSPFPITPAPSTSCLTPELNQIMFSYSTNLPYVCELLAPLNQTDLSCLGLFIPTVPVFANHVCGVFIDGFNCTEEMEMLMNSCPQPGPNNTCPVGCSPLSIFGSYVCIRDPAASYNATCNPCLASYQAGLKTMTTALWSNATQVPNPASYNGLYATRLTNDIEILGMCASYNTTSTNASSSQTTTLCLTEVKDLVLSLIAAQSALPTADAAIVASSFCGTPRKETCLRNGLMGFGVFLWQMIQEIDHGNATNLGVLTSYANAATDMMTTAAHLCDTTATTNGRGMQSSCASLLATLNGTLQSQCSVELALGGACSAACDAFVNQSFATLGSCIRGLWLSGGTGFERCPSFATLNASLPSTLPSSSSDPNSRWYEMTATVSAPCNLLATNATLAYLVANSVAYDFALATATSVRGAAVQASCGDDEISTGLNANSVVVFEFFGQPVDVSAVSSALSLNDNAPNTAYTLFSYGITTTPVEIAVRQVAPPATMSPRTTAPVTSSPTKTAASTTLSIGAKVGIGIGAVAAIIAIVFVVVQLRARRRAGYDAPESGIDQMNHATAVNQQSYS